MQDFQGFYTCNDNTNIEGNGDVVQDPCPSNYIEGMIREVSLSLIILSGGLADMFVSLETGRSRYRYR